MKGTWRKSFFLVLVAAGLALGASRPAGAISLEFEPPSQTMSEGQQVSVSVNLTGLGSTLIGAYNVSVLFDPSVVEFLKAVPGPALGAPSESFFDFSLTADAVDVAETSFLSDLTGQHSGDLFLFTLQFNCLAQGVTPLSFSALTLADESGLTLTDETGNPIAVEFGEASVTVTQTVIPEPGTLLLLGSGLIGLARRGRRTPARRG